MCVCVYECTHSCNSWIILIIIIIVVVVVVVNFINRSIINSLDNVSCIPPTSQIIEHIQ